MGESLANILVVEDDESLRAVIVETLREAGFTCETAVDGMKGLDRALKGSFDLLILDVNLPGLSGFDICRKVRAENSILPIIMLTARGEEADVVSGLELGANDYIKKPFQSLELLARIRVQLRDATERKIREMGKPASSDASEEDKPIKLGELEVDLRRHRITKRGEVLDLSAKEFQIVALLASNPGKVFSREELLEKVWNVSSENYSVNVSIMLSRLRKKLEDDPEKPRYFITVRGVGYRFVEESELA